MLNTLWVISDRFGCGVYRAFTPALTLQDRKITDNDFILHAEVREDDYTILNNRDIVVFQRAVGPRFKKLMQECKRRGITAIFETDDDVFNVPRSNPASVFFRKRETRKVLKEQLELADMVLVSTVPLAQEVAAAMDWPVGHKVRVCPNHLHPDIWGDKVWGRVVPYPNVNPQTNERYTVIGWQGSRTHNEDFKVVLPALTRLLDERPTLQIRFFGCVPLSVKGVIPGSRFQFSKGVEFEKYPATLRYMAFDIGIAPIQDTRFNQSKSNIKYLEYSALGTPCVAANVYPYAQTIQHGSTGYLAETPDDWYEHLSALLDSAELRNRIGEAAQQAAWAQFGTAHADTWVNALLQAHHAGEPALKQAS